MKRKYLIGLLLFLISISLVYGVTATIRLSTSGFSNPNTVAMRYLTCLWHKDYDRAKKLATPETAENLDMMKSLGTDFGLTVVKDIACITNGDEATCTFCCSKDTSFKELKLKKINEQWYAHQPKETPPADTTDVAVPKTAEQIEMERRQH